MKFATHAEEVGLIPFLGKYFTTYESYENKTTV